MPASSGAIRAGQAFVELFADDTRLVKGLRSAQARLQAWGAVVTRMGTQLFAAGSAVLGAFSGAAVVFGEMGSALDDMSQRTNVSVESLSGLKHAAEMSGTSLGAVEASLRHLSRKVAGGGKEFAKLGLSIEMLQGLDPEAQFHAVAEALSKVGNPTERAALAMQVLGQGATELLPMLAKGSAGLNEMHQEALRLGLVMTTAEAKSAAEFGDSLDTLWSQLKMVTAMIGSAVVPALTTLLKWSQPVIANVIAWIRANRPLLANLFAVAAGVTALGGTLLGLGASLKVTAWAISPLIRSFQLFAGGVNMAIRAGAWLVKLLGTAVVPMLRTAASAVVAVGKAVVTMLVQGLAAGASAAAGGIAAIMTPIGVLGVALAGLAGYILYVSGVFGDLLDAGTTTWEGLKTTAVTAWGAIGEALANGNLVAAGKVAWNALVLEWTRGTNAFKNVWTNFSAFLQNVFAEASSNLASGMVKTWATVSRAWEKSVSYIAQLWDDLIAGIAQAGLELMSNDMLMGAMTLGQWEGFTDAEQAQISQGLRFERIGRQVGRTMSTQQELAGINRTEQQMLASIEQQRAAKEAEINAARDATLAEREAALQAAQAEFDAAVAAAREAPIANEEVKTAAATIGESKLGVQRAAAAAGGTFSAFADRMFASGDDVQEQQLETLRRIEESTRKMARNDLKFA